MKHRFLITAMASIMLAGGAGAVSTAIAPTQTVQAISKHSYHWHLVKTTKDRKVYKLRFPLYRSPVFNGVLGKHSIALVRYVPNHRYFELDGWANHGHYAILGSSSSWFRNKQKNSPTPMKGRA